MEGKLEPLHEWEGGRGERVLIQLCLLSLVERQHFS